MDNADTPAKMDEDKQYIKQTQKAKNTINTVPTIYPVTGKTEVDATISSDLFIYITLKVGFCYRCSHNMVKLKNNCLCLK